MDHFYERNVSEIKNEYTTFLINLMTPFIYEGIRSVYQFGLNAHKEFIERGKHDPEVKSPGVLKIFQLSLKEIPTLNNNSIEIEANRIKAGSKCADWFDDLVKAVIKSNIVLLIFANPKKRSEILKEEYHNKIEIKDFVHKCYIESARMIYNNPELFWHEFPPLEIKRNQREACDLIKQAIQEAVRKVLPIKLILKEYLQNNYIDDDNDIANRISDTQYLNVHSMVKRDLYGGGENDPLGREQVKVNSVLESSEEEDLEKDQDSSSASSSPSSSREHGPDDNDDLDGGGSEDLLDDDNEDQDGGDDDFLNDVKQKLEAIEHPKQPSVSLVQEIKPQPTVNLPVEPKPEPPKPEPPKPVEPSLEEKLKKLSEGGGIPRAGLDSEIKELLKKSNAVSTLERPKGKVNKREAILMKEIEDQLKPKVDEPDRKLFFEQYMK